VINKVNDIVYLDLSDLAGSIRLISLILFRVAFYSHFARVKTGYPYDDKEK
jgi:hypothetical protein